MFRRHSTDRVGYCSKVCSGTAIARRRQPELERRRTERQAIRDAERAQALAERTRTCRLCGYAFLLRRGEREVCYARRCDYRMRHPVTERRCPECGRRHFRPHMGTDFCSNRCARRVARRETRIRRRLRIKRRSVGEPIYMDWVFVRDDGICGVCGKPVDRGLPTRDPRSATIDHVFPLSKGGLHALENVQLAHFVCNSIKRDLTQGWRRVESQPLPLTALVLVRPIEGAA